MDYCKRERTGNEKGMKERKDGCVKRREVYQWKGGELAEWIPGKASGKVEERERDRMNDRVEEYEGRQTRSVIMWEGGKGEEEQKTKDKIR